MLLTIYELESIIRHSPYIDNCVKMSRRCFKMFLTVCASEQRHNYTSYIQRVLSNDNSTALLLSWLVLDLCENALNDTSCDMWASEGRCEADVTAMTQNCRRSCNRCDELLETVPGNRQKLNICLQARFVKRSSNNCCSAKQIDLFAFCCRFHAFLHKKRVVSRLFVSFDFGVMPFMH